MVSLILYLILSRQSKDVSAVFSIAVCCAVAIIAFTYFAPVIDFLKELQSAGDLDSELMGVLLRVVGIGILGEIIGLLCADAGNAALARTFQVLSVIMILWVSLPILQGVFELIEDVLTAI